MATIGQFPSCPNPDCKVSETGRCVEDYSLDDCPHFGRDTYTDVIDGEPKDNTFDNAEEGSSELPLAIGEALAERAAAAQLTLGRSRVIGIAGPNDAGKTSLIAGLYELFQCGPVGGTTFAGSTTLIGLERLCHHARVHSKRNVPYTPRTSFGADATFLHLNVLPSGDREPIALLVGDRAGEDYVAVADEIAQAAKLFELRRADTITVLVNGERLVDDEERQEAIGQPISMLQGFSEGEVLSGGQQLALVLTKCDTIDISPRSDRARNDFEQIVARVRMRFACAFSRIEAFEIAASPRHGNLQRGTGIDGLLVYWLRPSTPPEIERYKPPALRMFDRLTIAEGAEG